MDFHASTDTLSEEIQASWNSGEGGSNAIVLPGTRKNKTKGGSKVKKQKEAPILSKSKQKKLKLLEEEKRKKLLQQKSIEILEKHKISDGAYSILRSSGTLGQAETFKMRRLRAIQLSKAGLEVPEDKLLHKRKKNNNIIDENEDNLKINSDQCFTEKATSHCVTLSKRNERGCDSHGLSAITETHDEGQKITCDGESAVSCLNSRDATELKTTNMKENQKQSSAALISNGSKVDNKLEDKVDDTSHKKVEQARAITTCVFQDHTSSTIVVNVSRPHEVEEKRKELPIIMMEQEIMEAINENFILILCGETGCGKTTQVPQFLYEAGFGTSHRSDRKGIIGVTQPRRVAVLATAKRVSYELGLRLGKEVGFQVRHDKLIGKNCSIKFMTDGILLREVQSDFLLKKYSIIILDEAHERSLNTDILIGMLSRVITLRQKLYLEQQENIRLGVIVSPENRITPLKLVLMSATLRVDDFTSNRKLFDQTAPVLEVPTRQFPVAIHFSKRTNDDYIGQAYRKVISIHRKLPPGGILVFVTGQREVEFLCKRLRKASRNRSKKNTEKSLETELTTSVEMKEIDEAFNSRHDSPDQHIDTFSTYEEEVEDLDSYSPLSDSSSDSELDFQSDDEDNVETQIPENASSILDFLRDDDNLSSLQASFDALAGNSNKANFEAAESLELAPTPSKNSQHDPPSPGPLYVLPLYAVLPASSQLQVFEEVPEGERLVVVATNVAETSLTIPGIKYVVDTGKEKVKKYNYKNGVASYEVTWISKASAAQRAGRAGRTGPGHCYRLYSAGAFSKDYMFPQFSCPEILKTPVDGVVLLMKSMGIDKVANFPFPSPPNADALLEAECCLKAIEALDCQGKLTPIGRVMAQYPMSPRHSRMLLTVIKIMKIQKGYSRANFLLGYAIASVAALSFANPFTMKFGEDHETNNGMDQEEKSNPMEIVDEDKRQKKGKIIAKEARERFCNPTSDVLTIAYALQLFELARDPATFCRDNSLNLKIMEDISKLRKQLLQLVFHQTRFSEDFSWDHGTAEDVEFAWRCHSDKQPLRMIEEELIGQAICAGWLDRIAKRVHGAKKTLESDVKVRAIRYQSCALNDIVYLNRQSSVSRTAPEFLVYTELLQTKRPYMHGVTSIKPDWLVRYGSFLCTFSAPLTDPKPYYEPMSDQVLCWISTSFGRHNWPLPLHTIPFKNVQNLSVFAAALLEGLVLPCLKSVQNFLVAPPSMMLRPEGMCQRRASDLMKSLKIGSKTIDSRAILREVWDLKPEHLKTEIQQWFQERYQAQFENIWERMHFEVRLEGHELFPKRVKKNSKLAK